MSLSQEVLNQITAFPPEFQDINHVADTLPAVILSGAGLYGLSRVVTDHKRSPRTEAGLAGADPVALELAAAERPKFRSHLRKISAVGAASLALVTMGIDQLDPTVETETIDPNATTSIIIDASFSMRYPEDMSDDETRLGAAFDGVINSLDTVQEEANPWVIIAGDGRTDDYIPAGSLDTRYRNDLDLSSVESQDTVNIAPSINQAVDFHGSERGGDFSQVIITDGTVTDATQVQEILNTLEDSKTTVILTGTAEGTYNPSGIEGADVAAAVNQNFLADAEGVNVIPATDDHRIEEILEETITNTSVRTERQDWKVLEYAAGAAIAFAGFKLIFGKNKPLRRGPINRSKKEQ